MVKKKQSVFCLMNYPTVGKQSFDTTAQSVDDAANSILTRLGETMNVSDNSDNAFVIFTVKNKKNERKYIYIGTRVELYQADTNNNMVKKYRNIYTVFDNKLSLKENIKRTLPIRSF